nr:RNA-directed DNA polymerase, eukaryota [Tanacetum cinerariifolium]
MDLISVLDCVILSPAKDRWICDINEDGLFRVKDIRSSIDSILLLSDVISTRWVKYVPIKINVFVWRYVDGGSFIVRTCLHLQIGMFGSPLSDVRLSPKSC